MSNESVPEQTNESFARFFAIEGRPEFTLQVNMGGLPLTLMETGSQYFIIDEVIKKLEARKDVLKKHGINQICEGAPNVVGEIKRDGVRYVGFERDNVSWSKACERIIEELVPKTRREDAEVIVMGFTKSSVVQKLERDA